MYHNYKIISVTPAGRKKNLEVLIPYLLKERNIIDEHHFWINTNNKSDIEYIENMCDKHRFFKPIYPKMHVEDGIKVINSIHHFFPKYVDKNTIYIRFDDDICYLDKDAVVNLLDARLKHPHYFLVYPHIVNNSMNRIKHRSPFAHIPGDWYEDAEHVKEKHEYFLDNLHDIDKFKIEDFEFLACFNINCICWFGEEFAKFGGKVREDEEAWLAELYPEQIGKKNFVCGNSIVSHFAFRSQIDKLKETNLLNRYKNLTQPKLI